MSDDYVEKQDQRYVLRGTRVSLDSVVYGFLNGDSAETIRDNFPSLNLAQVYGAITYYLEHHTEIDRYLQDAQARFEDTRRAQVHVSDDLRSRIDRRRREMAPRS